MNTYNPPDTCFMCPSTVPQFPPHIVIMALRKLIPLADRVLIKRVVPEMVTAGGILLPDSQKKSTREGEVVAVGPGALLKDGSRAAVSLAIGDMVLLPEYGGTKVELQEDGADEFVLYRDDDILGVYER